MSSEMQKVGDVTFRIVDSNIDMGFVWRDGSLYLTLHNVMITDGDVWYEIPIKDLESIEAEEEALSFVVGSMRIKMKGRNAERLMALRHLLLPLISGEPAGNDLTESIIKLIMIGINDEEVLASLLKRDREDVRNALDIAEREGLISGGKVTEKGRERIPLEEREILSDLKVKADRREME